MGRAANKSGVGKFDARIRVEYNTKVPSLSGEVVSTWSLKFETWANMENATTGSNDLVLGDQNTSNTRVNFKIRYRDDVNETMRVKYQNQVYQIITLSSDAKRIYLDIKTEKQL